jgi:hypothetical protein
MTYGLTIKRETTAPNTDDDSFPNPRPPIVSPSKPVQFKSSNKDHTPAPSLVERARQQGNHKLAELLQQATQHAKHHARKAEDQPQRREKKPSGVIGVVKKHIPTSHYDESHICDDLTFIQRTRCLDAHSAEMKALFYANGGQRYMDLGMVYGAALDMLRRDKAAKLRASNSSINAPVDKLSGKAYVPGLPTPAQLTARENAEKDAVKRQLDKAWLELPMRWTKKNKGE